MADPSGVVSRDDFADFVHEVLTDLRDRGESEWENGDLDRFLEALAAFSSARVVDAGSQEQPTWRLFAAMIVAATGYE